MVEKIERLMGGDVKGKQVAVLGLSFKPETDDMREAPSVDIIARSWRRARACARTTPSRWSRRRRFCQTSSTRGRVRGREGADVLVFMTEWNQFRALDMQKIKGLMRAPRIADLRNIYEPQRMRELGFDYVGVGR
jgi:UDPglucose 6-dehydrogenase